MVAWREVARAAVAGAADALYPPCCPVCDASVAAAHGLCAACWDEAELTGGAGCPRCAMPLEGGPCEACHARPRPWRRAKAALVYAGPGRAAVLALKHGDRPDLAVIGARMIAGAAPRLLRDAEAVVPVPLHWRRLLRRRYNQAAELSRALCATHRLRHVPGALRRVRATEMQRAGRAARAANLEGAFEVPPRRRAAVAGRRVLLIDDVMTTGATLDAATRALLAGGAAAVDVAVLARAVPGRAS